MNDYNVDEHEFGRHVREAQQMRSDAIRALARSAWSALTRARVRIGALRASRKQRRQWNQSVPAPHR